ncbi:hypothetical protein AB0N71_10710 [Pseudarthrobacter enclensis]|uniref:hypothetical protein n=1 Tax=Pseudarthrobacter enclensis TaxID=993070 RepID=UPI003424AF91
MRIANLWGRDDGGGQDSAVVDPSPGDAFAGARSTDDRAGTVRLQLTVWEQWA